MMTLFYFNVYNYKIKIVGKDLDKLKIKQDFLFFSVSSETNPNLIVQIFPLESIQKKGVRLFQTRMCEVRQLSFSKRQMIYGYNGEILAIVEDDTSKSCRSILLFAKNSEVIDDVLYFLINSCVGEYLDQTGHMRVHSLSCSSVNKISMVYGAQGSGKSTLAVALLNYKNFKIFSDEISILDLATQKIFPYPIRIGCADLSQLAPSDSKFTYFFNTKKLIDIPIERIAEPAVITHFFYISKKSNTRFRVFFGMMLGVGLIQMREYLIRPNNVFSILKILKNRLKLCFIINRISIEHLKQHTQAREQITKLE